MFSCKVTLSAFVCWELECNASAMTVIYTVKTEPEMSSNAVL